MLLPGGCVTIEYKGERREEKNTDDEKKKEKEGTLCHKDISVPVLHSFSRILYGVYQDENKSLMRLRTSSVCTTYDVHPMPEVVPK